MMIQLTIHLPKRLKLSLKLERKRGHELLHGKDNKTSFFFRHIFEHKKFKKVVGTNLALIFFASSLLPKTTSGSENIEINSINSPLVLNTEESTQFPVKEVKITQQFSFYHPGVDFDGKTGDTIFPIMEGKVKKIEYSRFGYGKSITISHKGKLESLYAHLSKIEVVEGQEVTKEEKIGEMGATGRAFGDHLHLEVRENSKAINPLTILSH